jgi:hypothetical protein
MIYLCPAGIDSRLNQRRLAILFFLSPFSSRRFKTFMTVLPIAWRASFQKVVSIMSIAATPASLVSLFFCPAENARKLGAFEDFFQLKGNEGARPLVVLNSSQTRPEMKFIQTPNKIRNVISRYYSFVDNHTLFRLQIQQGPKPEQSRLTGLASRDSLFSLDSH